MNRNVVCFLSLWQLVKMFHKEMLLIYLGRTRLRSEEILFKKKVKRKPFNQISATYSILSLMLLEKSLWIVRKCMWFGLVRRINQTQTNTRDTKIKEFF